MYWLRDNDIGINIDLAMCIYLFIKMVEGFQTKEMRPPKTAPRS